MPDPRPPAAVPSTVQAPPLLAQGRARAILALVIVAIAVYTISGFLTAIAWGVVFAIATWPLYCSACARWPKAASGPILPLLFTAALALIFLIPLTLLALEAGNEARGMFKWFHVARDSGVPMPAWVNRLPFGRAAITSWWQTTLSDPENVHDLLSSFDNRGLTMTRVVGTQIIHRATLFCFSILTLFFLYKDGTSVIRQCLIASRRAFGKRGEVVAQQIVASVHGTVAGLVLVGIGEGAVLGVVYVIAGAPHSILFGAVTALAAMVPFCGMIAVGITALMILVTGSAAAAIATFVIGWLVIFLADHFIRPGLIGGSTQLPFLWVLFGILGGAETWGLLGLFVGPAAMATLHLLWRNWTRERSGSVNGAA